MEMTEMMDQLNAGIARLAQAAEALEGSAGRMTAEAGGSVSKITAAIEGGAARGPARGIDGWSPREAELQRRLDQALGALTALQAEGAPGERRVSARKTLPAATVQLLAKQGVDVADAVDVTTLDAALAGMSVEQRIAVKSQLLRTGSLTL
jgi:hypothetical protein